jgi:hypothetical protein
VAEKLGELELLSLEFQASIRKQPRHAADRVMAMREEFNDLCVALVREMAAEPRIASNRAVFEAMQNAIEMLRTRMMAHQLKWDATRIEQDPIGYFEAVQPLNDVLREFVKNARVFVPD